MKLSGIRCTTTSNPSNICVLCVHRLTRPPNRGTRNYSAAAPPTTPSRTTNHIQYSLCGCNHISAIPYNYCDEMARTWARTWARTCSMPWQKMVMVRLWYSVRLLLVSVSISPHHNIIISSARRKISEHL